MYWIRSDSFPDFALYTLLTLMWVIGGWLIATHAFKQRSNERFLTGLGIGLLLFITMSNLLANFLPSSLTFWTASTLVLLFGLFVAWRSKLRPWLALSDIREWRLLLSLVGLTLLFTLIGRGFALYDDYLHIPLVSTMATGNIPPTFYLNPELHFAYHYGLQIFAASLSQLGGFFPWSAWDLSKAFAIALTILLSWLYYRQVLRDHMGATFGSILIALSSGARWLLLFIPLAILANISNTIQMTNTGADTAVDLISALSQPWIAEGSAPFPFPFSFYNGLFLPLILALGASGALPYMTLVLLLLLNRLRRFSTPGIITLILLFASLALSAEFIYVILWAGIALAIIIYLIQRWRKHKPVSKGFIIQWGLILVISGILSITQGAFLTEAARNFLLAMQGVESGTGGSYDYFSFALRWPPAMDTAHLGELSLLNPAQLVVLLAELGLTLFLAPLVTIYAWRQIPRRKWIAAGLGIAAAISFLMAVFLRYGVERSSNRLPSIALWIWILLGWPILWKMFQKGTHLQRYLLGLGYGITIFSGAVLLAVSITSLPAPQLTYFVNSNDARLSDTYWDRLPENAQIFDRIPERAVALFGRPSKANLDFYHPLPEWSALLADPDPVRMAEAGYSFVYIDDVWWWEMEQEQREAFNHPCVSLYAEMETDDGDFRWLVDVRDCR
jgi:hypothetical protein